MKPVRGHERCTDDPAFRFTIKIDKVKSENTAFFTLHYAKNLKIKRN